MSGKDFIIFSQDLMGELRNDLLDYYLNKVEKYPLDFILRFINKLDKMLIELKNSNNVRILFEASILSFTDEKIILGMTGQLNTDPVEKKFDAKESSDVKIISREIKQVDENASTVQKQEEKTLGSTEVVQKLENIAENEKNYKNNQNVIRFQIVNNTFATAQKQFLISLKEQWNKINDFVLDQLYGASACYLVDSVLRAVGEKDLIITCNYESVLDRGLSLISNMEKLLEKLTGVCYNIAILTNQEWVEERSKFIEAKNNGTPYVYQELRKDAFKETIDLEDNSSDVDQDQSDLVQQAISIFGKDIVKISE